MKLWGLGNVPLNNTVRCYSLLSRIWAMLYALLFYWVFLPWYAAKSQLQNQWDQLWIEPVSQKTPSLWASILKHAVRILLGCWLTWSSKTPDTNLGVVIHIGNPSTWKAEARGSEGIPHYIASLRPGDAGPNKQRQTMLGTCIRFVCAAVSKLRWFCVSFWRIVLNQGAKIYVNGTHVAGFWFGFANSKHWQGTEKQQRMRYYFFSLFLAVLQIWQHQQ